MFEPYMSLSVNSTFPLVQVFIRCNNAVLMLWLGLGTKTHLVEVGKRSCFGLKYLTVITSNTVGDVLLPQPLLDCNSRAHEHVM